jgi:hypothetical protein
MRRGVSQKPSVATPSLSVSSSTHLSKGRRSRRPTLSCILLGSTFMVVLYNSQILSLDSRFAEPPDQARLNAKPNQPVPSAHPEAVEPLKDESLEKTCKLLSIYPPHLLNINKTVPSETQEKL